VRLIRLVVLTMFACMTLIAVAVYISRVQPLPEKFAFVRLVDCVLPCWIGIIPGKTTIFEARTVIRNVYPSAAFDVTDLPTWSLYPFAIAMQVQHKREPRQLFITLNQFATEEQTEDSVVHDIQLYTYSPDEQFETDVNVGDMMLLLGEPMCLSAIWGNHNAWPGMLYPQYHTELSFGDNSFSVAPDLPTEIRISDRPLSCKWNNSIPWRGFHSRYPEQFIASMQP